MYENLSIANTYQELSELAASDLLSITKNTKKPLICPASGDSPAGLYKAIVLYKEKNDLDISAWKFVGLDEWVGMNGENEGSCRYHLNKDFFSPLEISESNICFFNGRAKNLENECSLTQSFIAEQGGIDIAILGLGMNGHVGMNEPGTNPNLYAHVVNIDPITQKVGQKYFSKPQELTQGITLGIATLREAKNIFLIVSGEKKAPIVGKLLNNPVSPQLPGSLLLDHPGLRIYLDKNAAQFIDHG